ncbi:unnamed protein product, partial [Rotaria sp. Silwood1]
CIYYRGTGDITDWTKRSYSITASTRKMINIPGGIKTEYDAFANARYLIEDESQKIIENLQETQSLNIYIVSEEFLNEIKNDCPSKIMGNSISNDACTPRES